MSDPALSIVERGMQITQLRAAVLAADTANARTRGFTALDVVPVVERTASGLRFAGAVRAAHAVGVGETTAFAMAATAENSVRFKALAEQERAILREYRAVAEDARR